MSGLAVLVTLDGRPRDCDQARVMAGASSYRGQSGFREVCSGPAVAIYLDGGEEPGVESSTPIVSRDGSVLLVADARIDNRREVAAALGCGDIALRRDDAALALEAYRHWGAAFGDYLCGDFAVVVWDAGSRQLVAARDPMAMRPLVYRAEPGRILVASEVKQILAAAAVSRRPYEPQIAAALAGSPGLPEWTFYDGVQRLAPGHTLVVDTNGPHLRAPSDFAEGDDSPSARSDDYVDELRARLTEAVNVRLEVTRAPGLLLSGGLDSTAIAGVAGRLRHHGSLAPAFYAYSFAYTDVPQCDERAVSDLVAAAYGIRNVAVPAAGAWPLADHPAHGTDLDGPDRFRSHVLFDRSIEAARRDDIGVMMSGHRGDSIAGDAVDYLGLLRGAGPGAFWRDLTEHSRRSRQSRASLVRHHVLRRLPAAMWSRSLMPEVRRRWRQSFRPAYLPRWLRPEMIDRFGLRDLVEPPIPPARLRGEARRRRFQLIFDPQRGRNSEALERLFARSGIRHGDPWADRRLVELILRMPQYLITPGGEAKGLLREAMRGVLPEPARLAALKRSPQPFYERGLLNRSRNAVWSLINGSQAAARGYVDEKALRAAYSAFLERKSPVGERNWRFFWRFLDVEDWLRRFHPLV